MATAVVARPVARPQPRARDEEVLVWPDLVFVEFVSALLFTITLFLLAFLINAPLLDQANADVTPNPSKAPWYLLNLQELLLHMNAAMAGVIIPTIWLGIMMAFPYFDREQEGQGAWFGTENAWRITLVCGTVGIVGTVFLILWDSGKIAFFLNDWFGISGGDRWRFLGLAPRILTGVLARRDFWNEVMTPSSMKECYIPVSREQGELLYLTARAIEARHVVEFGTSFGISTVYLAAGVRDNGGGLVIGSEIEPSKQRQAEANLAEADLKEFAEVRLGDALETLRDLPAPIPAPPLRSAPGSSGRARGRVPRRREPRPPPPRRATRAGP